MRHHPPALDKQPITESMKPTGFDHHGPDHSGPSSRVALPSVRMSTEEVLKALERYTEEARESDRQTATKLGVNRMTLTAPASNGLLSEHAFFEYKAKLIRQSRFPSQVLNGTTLTSSIRVLRAL